LTLDAIFYLVRGGTAWAQLPHDFPPYHTVYGIYGGPTAHQRRTRSSPGVVHPGANATSFTNTYLWGNFRGNPRELVEKYYDAHL
jgi:hypothetical protein